MSVVQIEGLEPTDGTGKPRAVRVLNPGDSLAGGPATVVLVSSGGVEAGLPANDGADIHKQVTNSSVQITATPTAYNRGMLVDAPSTNDQTIWLKIGVSKTAVAGEGKEMRPGTTLTFGPDELQDASLLYAVAAAASTLSYINVIGLTRT